MKRKLAKRVLAVFMAFAMAVAMMPALEIGGTAQADTVQDKRITDLGIYPIANPKPGSKDKAWEGSYVWFGKFNEQPIRFRVLQRATTVYTKQSEETMFLQSDLELGYKKFNNTDGTETVINQWANSNVRDYLSTTFYSESFTGAEQSAIAPSTVSAHEYTVGTAAGNVHRYIAEDFYEYCPLNQDTVFLLDCEEISNTEYGYCVYESVGSNVSRQIYSDSSTSTVYYWLRSRSKRGNGNKCVGHVGCDGCIYSNDLAVSQMGLVPALNLDIRKIMFTSCIKGTAGASGAEYKLTLRDSNINISVPGGFFPGIVGNTISVPYKVTGSDRGNTTQISVLILDKSYRAVYDASENRPQVISYAKAQYTGSLSGDGQVSFALPSTLNLADWGKKYHVYILAEDVNGDHESDYCSGPCELSTPVDGNLSFSQQPSNASVTVGDTAAFSVKVASNAPLTYQWQYMEPGSNTWVDSTQSGAKTASLTITTVLAYNGYKYRCFVRSKTGQAIASNAVTLTVNKPAFVFTQQPVSAEAIVGDIVTFSVKSNAMGNFSYQWQYLEPGTSTWKNSIQSGANTATLKVTTKGTHDGYQYRCQILLKDENETKTSRVATLTVIPNITKHPSDTTVTVGDVATFSVTATGKATLKYQWEYKSPSATEWSKSTQSGSRTAKLSVTTQAAHDGYQYRCVITDRNGKSVTSDPATITVTAKISKQPADKTVTLGEVAEFSVEAAGKRLKYQWQCKAPGATSWTDSKQKGAKTSNLSVSTVATHGGYQYRCVVTDAHGTTLCSNPATLTVKPKITTQPASRSASAGTTISFTVEVSGKATIKYQWQYLAPGSSTWQNSTHTGAKTSKLTLKVVSNHNGYQYRCMVTDGNKITVYSNAATVTVVK